MGLRRVWIGGFVFAVMLAVAMSAQGAQDKKDSDKKKDEEKVVVKGAAVAPEAELPGDSTTEGSVTVGGQAIAYKAVAGTLTVGSTDAQDALLGLDGKMLPDTGVNASDAAKPEDAPATARMFYAAYFKKGAASESRPVMFLYNGGPGSATMWLHMGSFGPKRVLTTDTQHAEGAPYKIVNNDYSLLDVAEHLIAQGMKGQGVKG